MHPFPYALIIPVVAIVGAFAYAIVQAFTRARVRELEIRERIALIEKGLVPPPETDPGGFERAMNLANLSAGYENRLGAGRHRRAGITLIGVGLGLMMLISFAGEAPSAGIGVGGFLATVGAAFLVNSFFESQPVPRRPAGVPPPNPPAPSDFGQNPN